MKICIMGPIPSKSQFGGVAQFDRALGYGFSQNDCEVIYCTEQSKSEIVQPSSVYTLSFSNVNHIIKMEQVDLIVASLSYVKYFPFIQHKCIKTYFLHGFFNIGHYGLVKAVLGWRFQKTFFRYCDRVYANSNYTKIICNDMMGLRVDKTALIGVAESMIRRATAVDVVCPRENRKLIFAGRLSLGKKIDVAIRAARELHQENEKFTFEIIGEGPAYDACRQIANHDEAICFLGQLTQEELFTREQDAEVFISLNPSEPYGMAYVEALMAGCKIICPQTGGQLEVLKDYPDWTTQVDPMEVESVKAGIKQALSARPKPLPTHDFKTKFSYSRTAGVILKDCKGLL